VRTHRAFSALQPWQWRAELVSELVSAERLVAARIEPVTRGREPTAFVDLHFSDGVRSITIPLIYLDLAQLDLRESDPLVFPQGLLGVVSDARARDVVERLYPDLERRAMTGGFWREDVLRYGAAPAFDAARERNLFGAAPLALTLPRVAPAVYAQRFAMGKHVMAYGAAALEHAGFLSGVASSSTVLGDDPVAAAWYGSFPAADPGQTFDLAIGDASPAVSAAIYVRTDPGAEGGLRVDAARPIPADILMSFDPADGPSVASFTVIAGREPFVRKAPDVVSLPGAQGSAGRIALVVRPDAEEAPDADTSEAAALALALAQDGFEAVVLSGVDALDAFAPDLVHLFGVRPGSYARAVGEWASRRRKPLAVHAYYESPAAGGYWGTAVTPYCFGYSADDRSVGAYLDMLSRRAVEVDNISAGSPYAPPIVGLGEGERVLALADVVLVNSERERAVVETLRPRRQTFVVAPLPVQTAAPEPVAARIGIDPFILVHAPIWPEANQLMLARAAADVGVALVLAGPIADPAYAERVREFASDRVMLIEEPSPGLVATLYRSASVVADAAWTARGHSRLLSAAAMGAAVVTSAMRWTTLPDGQFWIVDPGDLGSIARGLGEAWDASVRSDARLQSSARFAGERLTSSAAAVVGTYAKIVLAS
jgi:hypothetical protein